jgi:hypothetical protein
MRDVIPLLSAILGAAATVLVFHGLLQLWW